MKLKALTLSLLLGLAATSTFAEDQYIVRVPANVNLSAPDTPAPEEATSIALRAATLPAGTVGTPYGESQTGFDLSTLLDVTPSSYSLNDITWSVVSGALPAGLEIQADGKLTGTPTVKNEAGASFEVQASYKGADGRQVYTIVVGGQVLKVVQIAAGGSHTCAVTTSGGAKCWGYNINGQLGDGTTVSSLKPIGVFGFSSGVSAIATGQSHSCAIKDSALYCWGSNSNGQLGVTGMTSTPYPQLVSGLSSVASVSASQLHTCAVSSGAAWCWGSNPQGQLGNGTTLPSFTPQKVTALTSVVSQISTRANHTCAVASGQAWCWGRNAQGQLGDGSTTDRVLPVAVSSLGAVSKLAVSNVHTCALTQGGAVKCWGWNGSNGLGDNTWTHSSIPVQAIGLDTGVTDVTSGSESSCAIKGGTVYCWGRNNVGQLGDGTIEQRRVPAPVLGISEPAATVSAGEWHTCATLSSGAARCWGLNNSGGLGDGTANQSLVPVEVLP